LFVSCVFAVDQDNFFEEEMKGLELLPKFLPKNLTGPYCPTEDIWRWKLAKNGVAESLVCRTEGTCDVPATRNAWATRANAVKVIITVICATTGCPVTQTQVNNQMAQVQQDFAGTNFTFILSNTYFRTDNTYATIPAYSNNNQWYTAIQNMKNIYAQTPTTHLNFFITRQAQGSQGTLLGMGTFPWDAAADRNTGGLWMNANFIGSGYKTAAHEIGHCIGLWHTFHGDSEVACTSDCYEVVHQDFGDTTISNTVGDFCADTPAQPMNYNCQVPTTRDCRGTLYSAIPSSQTPTLTNNIMAYTPDTCMQRFTPQQTMRAQCWVCSRLRGWGNSAC